MDKSVFDDIINQPYHKSERHKPMERYMRAAQFAPFSALTGYEETICETGRETGEKIILDENQKEEINYKLSYLLDFPEENILSRITFFVPDKTKNGGEYVTVTDCIYKYNSMRKSVTTKEGHEIFIDDIISLEFT